MADPKGFIKFAREGPKRRPVELRLRDWKEFYEPFADDKLQTQGARCMDCGVPFCQ
ncbi:MAG: glutamate synthase, partial [Nitrospirota bacterium]